MGREKEKQILDDEARKAIARREGRKCVYCGSVIPIGQETLGHRGVCPSCVGALKDD